MSSRTSRRRPGLEAPAAQSPEQLTTDVRRTFGAVQRGAGRFAVTWSKDTDAAAGTTIGSRGVWSNALAPVSFDRIIEAASFTPFLALAGLGLTDYARFPLEIQTSASNVRYVGELRSDKANWPAWVAQPFALNGKSPIVKPGETVVVRLQKFGPTPGVIVPLGVVTIWLRDA